VSRALSRASRRVVSGSAGGQTERPGLCSAAATSRAATGCLEDRAGSARGLSFLGLGGGASLREWQELRPSRTLHGRPCTAQWSTQEGQGLLAKQSAPVEFFRHVSSSRCRPGEVRPRASSTSVHSWSRSLARRLWRRSVLVFSACWIRRRIFWLPSRPQRNWPPGAGLVQEENG